MVRMVHLAAVAIIVTGTVLSAQQAAKPMSPSSSTQAQVLGTWMKGERASFALGGERYVNGKWIEITYGRPLQRGRDLFGSGANYGKALNDLPLGEWGAPPVWRAGANVTTRLSTEVPLVIGDTRVPAGDYSLFIDVKGPAQWTLIVSSWPAQPKMDQKDKTAVWGAYGYTPDKDVARTAMKVEALPFDVEQLTWSFVDMTPDGGRIALTWGKTMASASFKAVMP